jgi:hypothetical protein
MRSETLMNMIGPVEFIFMVAAVAFVVYSGYYISTRSRRQVFLGWLVTGLVFAIATALVSILSKR